MFDVGYLTVARWQGTPIRIHWSTPIGMLLFGRLQFVPGLWLGYLLIVTLHEMGHALLSRRQGLRAISIEIHAFGGQCRYGGASISPWQRSVVAWGGVLAQVLVLAIALPIQLFAPLPPIAFVYELLHALVTINLMIMAFNLLPIPFFDGAEAWKIFGLWRARQGRRVARAARDRVEVRPSVPRRRGRDDERLELGEVDQERVRETVRRALSAARDPKNRNDPN